MNTELIAHPEEPKPAATPPRRRAIYYLSLAPVVLVLLLGTVWATAALYFDVRGLALTQRL